jgi:hypothetical protein
VGVNEVPDMQHERRQIEPTRLSKQQSLGTHAPTIPVSPVLRMPTAIERHAACGISGHMVTLRRLP